jgi:hypothetical protein
VRHVGNDGRILKECNLVAYREVLIPIVMKT